MALTVGSRIAHYDVTALIGEGGMGQVYQATDTKLNRQVALKILPDAFAADPDRLARFQREAQVLASLNHPGIAAIHGIEDSEDTRALVLELVEGPTLADRIAQGPIPVDEALPIAKQIAEALEAAHEAGVIHRDLKPANIKLKADGTVKVLDFGLAKAINTAPEGDPNQSPTLTAAATQMGVIMGTAAYMSPEQARGKPVDKRADVWAFGCVLFEMVSGTKPFPGDDISQTLARVIDRDPNWGALPATLPSALDTALRRCLQKDPRQRVRDIGDVSLAMDGAFEATGRTPTTPTATSLRLWQRPVPLAILALGLMGLTGVGVWSIARPSDPPSEGVRRYALDLGPTRPIRFTNVHAMPAWSPDGTRLVYTANVAGTTQLYLRTLDDLEARPIAGTENGFEPFFSPDGEWVGFGTPGLGSGGNPEFKRVAVGGGTTLTLCECFSYAGATWLPDGTVIVSRTAGEIVADGTTGSHLTLHRVPETGGGSEPVTTIDAAALGLGHLWPRALPGGTHLLFTILTDPTVTSADAGQIAVLALDTGQHHVVVEGGYNARYLSTGHLVFGRQGAVWGVPFDLDRLETTGPAEVLLQDVEFNAQFGSMALAVSRDGTLVYWPGGATRVTGVAGGGAGGRPVWVDRTGRATPIEGGRTNVAFPRLSPDERRLAMTSLTPDGQDIWIDDLERVTAVRLTNSGFSAFPVWSEDGTHVFFSDALGVGTRVFSRAADGSGESQLLASTDGLGAIPYSWTPTGGLSVWASSESSGGDIWTVSPDGERVPYLVGPEGVGSHDLSPDGRWMAYVSLESGQAEIYLQSYPDLGTKQTVSSGGGVAPLWSADGRELFYRNPAGDRMMVVDVETDPTLRISRPDLLFEGRYLSGEFGPVDGGRHYDVSADGQRFVMIREEPDHGPAAASTNSSLILVENWFEEVKRLVPTP